MNACTACTHDWMHVCTSYMCVCVCLCMLSYYCTFVYAYILILVLSYIHSCWSIEVVKLRFVTLVSVVILWEPQLHSDGVHCTALPKVAALVLDLTETELLLNIRRPRAACNCLIIEKSWMLILHEKILGMPPVLMSHACVPVGGACWKDLNFAYTWAVPSSGYSSSSHVDACVRACKFCIPSIVLLHQVVRHYSATLHIICN